MNAALAKLRETPKGRDLLAILENPESKKVHIIKESKEGNFSRPADPLDACRKGVGTGSVIRWNPGNLTGGKDEQGSDKRPPFIGLAHELGHSAAYEKGEHIGGRKGEQLMPGTKTPYNEKSSMQWENDIRQDQNPKIPKRPNYFE